VTGNGWRTVYQDEHVKINVGPHGETGVWYGGTGDWRLQNVRDYGVTFHGRGPTMHAAREEVRRQRRMPA
jgi:hypothetical protein